MILKFNLIVLARYKKTGIFIPVFYYLKNFVCKII